MCLFKKWENPTFKYTQKAESKKELKTEISKQTVNNIPIYLA